MHRLKKLEDEYLSKYYWMKDYIVNYLPKDKNARILVLGCGLGHEVWALNRMGYSNALGVDIDMKQVRIARSMGINCVCADALVFLEKLQENYDVILAFNFIEHFNLEDALKLCKLCYSRLSKGGAFILLTPNAANPLAMRNIYSDLTHKIGAFTETSIAQLLRSVGFNKIILCNVRPFGLEDRSLVKRLLKLIATVIIHVNWGIIKLFYIVNGILPPKVVSNDLLIIAIKD